MISHILKENVSVCIENEGLLIFKNHLWFHIYWKKMYLVLYCFDWLLHNFTSSATTDADVVIRHADAHQNDKPKDASNAVAPPSQPSARRQWGAPRDTLLNALQQAEITEDTLQGGDSKGRRPVVTKILNKFHDMSLSRATHFIFNLSKTSFQKNLESKP